MTDTTIILSAAWAIILFLLSIIAFFIKRILTKLDTYDAKFETLVTKTMCEGTREGCLEFRALSDRLDEKDKAIISKEFNNLTASFDSLCRCLKDYTKGVCP